MKIMVGKSNNKGLKIIAIIVFILLIAVISYMASNKYISKSKDNTDVEDNKPEEKVEYKLEDYIVIKKVESRLPI